MVGSTRRPRKGKHVRFAQPPWDERSQEWLDRDRLVPPDHRARDVVEAMNLLDLNPLFDLYVGVGVPAIRPDLMLRVVLIEIDSGRPRPSQWFRDVGENLALQWACFGIRPSRTGWYDFAQRIAPLLDSWNIAVVRYAREQGVTPAERIALDGTAVAAAASRHRLVNQATVQRRLVELDQACQADAVENPLVEVPSWMAKHPPTREVQRERYRHARKRLEELQAVNRRQTAKKQRKPEKIVVSVSEPEAALGRDKTHVFRPLYNVQLVRDLDSLLCLSYQVFAQPTDAGTLGPMIARTTEWLGATPKAALVDAGYVTACHLALCQQAGIAFFGPWQENDFSQKNRKSKKPDAKPTPLAKDQFTWRPEENQYRCPEGHPLPWLSRERRPQGDGQLHVVHTYRCPPQYCQACPRQTECTSNPKRGRSIKRSEHEALVEAHRARMATAEAKAVYRLRGQTVELQFADFKEHHCLRQFYGHGLRQAQRQVGLTVLVHNLLVVHRTSPPPKTTPAPPLTPSKITT